MMNKLLKLSNNIVIITELLFVMAQAEMLHGDVFQSHKFFDSPLKSEAVIEPEKSAISNLETLVVDGEGCTCVEYDNLAPWSHWGECETRHGKCHKATQSRNRMCISETDNCYQVRKRMCYHQNSCLGTWSKPTVLNSTCDAEENCGVVGTKLVLKFCTLNGLITSMCRGSDRDYKLVYRQCLIPCATNDSGDNAISTILGWSRADSLNNKDHNTQWTTIFLGVLAGVFLVALLSVSFTYWVSSRSRKLEFESSYYRPSNDVICTSDTVLTVSTPLIRTKQNDGRNRIGIEKADKNPTPSSQESLPINDLRVKEIPLGKSNSFSIGNCAKPTKKHTRDSLLSLSKLIKSRPKNNTLRHSSPENELIIERINLQGDGEVIVTSQKPNNNLT